MLPQHEGKETGKTRSGDDVGSRPDDFRVNTDQAFPGEADYGCISPESLGEYRVPETICEMENNPETGVAQGTP